MVIIFGDCVKSMKKIPSESVDLVVTSPPYYNAKDYSYYETREKYLAEMKKSFIQVNRILKSSKICIIIVSPILIPRNNRSDQSVRFPIPAYLTVIMESIGFVFLENIIWEKPKAAGVIRGTFHKTRKPIAYKPILVTECILVFKKKAPFLIDKILKNDSLVNGSYEETDIWKCSPISNSKHPAPFPKKIIENCIRYYSYEKDLVLDLFMGSGTTGIVCENLNRDFIGIEINKKFFNVARERLKKAYSKKSAR